MDKLVGSLLVAVGGRSRPQARSGPPNFFAGGADGDVSVIRYADVEERIPPLESPSQMHAVEVYVSRQLIFRSVIFDFKRPQINNLSSTNPVCHRPAL